MFTLHAPVNIVGKQTRYGNNILDLRNCTYDGKMVQFNLRVVYQRYALLCNFIKFNRKINQPRIRR